MPKKLDRNRNCAVNVYLTASEHRMLGEFCAMIGMSMSQYLRMKGLVAMQEHIKEQKEHQ